MFEKELNEFIKSSKESLEKMEKNVDSFRESMSSDISTLWGTLKEEFSQINGKLSDASEKLQDEAKLKNPVRTVKIRKYFKLN